MPPSSSVKKPAPSLASRKRDAADSIAGKPSGGPLSRPSLRRQATPESVAALSRDDLAAFHARYYTAANATITLVGDLSRQEAEGIVDKLLAGLPQGTVATLPPPPGLPKGGRIPIAHPASQAHIYIGLPAIERGNPDFFRSSSATTRWAAAASFSRLMKEVRDKRGYAYSVYSYFAPMRQPAPSRSACKPSAARRRKPSRWRATCWTAS
jgi:zinc protease